MIVEVAFLPTLAIDLNSKLCVVIDVLRATSTLVSMLDAGARRVVVAESIPAALACAEGNEEKALVCGESGGLPPAGFDMGNSPREFRPGTLEGKELVFCTSNGTKAMHQVMSAPLVLTGSLLNGSAAALTALREAKARALDIALVCSGDVLGTRFAIDDAFCAGYLVTLLERQAWAMPSAHSERRRRSHDPRAVERDGAEVSVTLDESAVAAVRLYRSYLAEVGGSDLELVPSRETILRAFWESHNARVLRSVGLAEDVEYCAQLDISSRVPRLEVERGRLVLR